MKHEMKPQHQPGHADFKFKKILSSGGGDGDGGGPSDKPPKYENHLNDLAIADMLVSQWLRDERFLPTLQIMQEKLPLTYLHEIQVARGATLVAIRFGTPDIVRIYTSQGGIMHDSGKLAFPNVNWDATDWSKEEKINNKNAVENHSIISADMTQHISKDVSDIVALHHIFQKPNPYPEPTHASYQRLLLPENSNAFTAARYLALIDHIEASITRNSNPSDAYLEELVARLKEHTFTSPNGEDIPAYTDDEIEFGMETYEVITLEASDKAA